MFAHELMATIKSAEAWQMNYTDDLFVVMKVCVEPATLFR